MILVQSHHSGPWHRISVLDLSSLVHHLPPASQGLKDPCVLSSKNLAWAGKLISSTGLPIASVFTPFKTNCTQCFYQTLEIYYCQYLPSWKCTSSFKSMQMPWLTSPWAPAITFYLAGTGWTKINLQCYPRSGKIQQLPNGASSENNSLTSPSTSHSTSCQPGRTTVTTPFPMYLIPGLQALQKNVTFSLKLLFLGEEKR